MFTNPSMFPLRKSEKPPEMTVERAVSLLSQDDEDSLISAAGYIQSQCFKSADAKKMVSFLVLHSSYANIPKFKIGIIGRYQLSEAHGRYRSSIFGILD